MSWMRVALLSCLLISAAATAMAAMPRQDLSQFMGSAPPCLPDAKPTPALPTDNTFKAGSPLRSVLADPSVVGTRLTLSGTVAGTKCGRIAGAEIDLWHADIRGAYDMLGFGLRGHQLTNKDGGYTFLTIVPGAPAGRVKHLNLRIRVKGHQDFFTEVFFPGDAAAPRDKRYRTELLLQPKQATAGGQAATFDVLLEM